MRWDIETQYKYLKVDLEVERFNTTSENVFLCKALAKILLINVVGIIKSEVNLIVESHATKKHTYGHKTKVNTIIDQIRESRFLYYLYNQHIRKLINLIKEIFHNALKNKVPIRPNRHFMRYGRFTRSLPRYRYTTDGRNHPRAYHKLKLGYITVRN